MKSIKTPVGILYTETISDEMLVTDNPEAVEQFRQKMLKKGHSISHSDGTTEHHSVNEDYPEVWDKSGERTRHTVTRIIKETAKSSLNP